MRREVLTEDLKRLYTANDMVKTDCGDAKDVLSAAVEWEHQLSWILMTVIA